MGYEGTLRCLSGMSFFLEYLTLDLKSKVIDILHLNKRNV